MDWIWVRLAVAIAVASGCASVVKAAEAPKRIVCLGDSITDGHTYPLLVQQALREAGKPVPVMIGAGIGGDNGAGMLARLDRDVFVHKPDLVMLSDSINDSGLSTTEFEKTIRRLLDKFKEHHVAVMVLTSTTVSPRHAGLRPHLAELNDTLRRLAKEYGYALADVNARMSEAPADEELWEPNDGVHLNFAGYRRMVRAVVDALGYADVAVPKEATIELLPGVIHEWRIKAASKDTKPLDDDDAKATKPDDTWKPYSLPETDPIDSWWRDHQRQRGVAMQLEKTAGKADRYLGYAVVKSDAARDAFLNTGADLKSVWLNGQRIYQQNGPAGWHPGRDRIKVHLNQGDNVLLIESGPHFFVSMTDDDQWG